MEQIAEGAVDPPADQEEDLEGRGTAFEVRGRRRKGKKPAPGSHELSFNVTCALALSSSAPAALPGAGNGTAEGSVIQGDGESVLGQSMRGAPGSEGPRAYGYYHMEYKLFPEDNEPMRTDVVNYGVAARVYPERTDSRTIKTWPGPGAAEHVWVAWSQSVKVSISNDVLKSVASHEIVLRVWDSKEKCSSRCRWDSKPKAFRFPPPKPGQDPENVGGVKALVLRLSKSFERLLGSKMAPERPLPHHTAAPPILRTQNQQAGAQDKAEKPKEPTYALYAVPKADPDPNARSFSRLLRLANTDVEPERRPAVVRTAKAPVIVAKGASNRPSSPPKEAVPGGEGIAGAGDEVEAGKTARPRRGRKTTDEDAKRVEKEGRCSITLSLAGLFIGQTVTARLSNPAASIEDMFISVTINGPLLSEAQRKELNPLVVRIRGADCMPERPLSFDQLRNSCEEVFCRYRFLDQPFHRTQGRPHGKRVEWNDVKVFLTGMYDPGILREFLGGAGMELEVHDRDRRPIEEKLPPALFGDDLEDEKISNIGIVTAKRTVHSAFGSDLKPWDPYGICRLDLSGLLAGHKLLCFTLPILPCSTPDQIRGDVDSDNRVLGTAGAVDGPSQPPLPAGEYLETGSTLKITLELGQPLNQDSSQVAKCAFGRLVFDIAQVRLFFVRKILAFVKETNARALGYDSLAPHVISNALLNHRLTSEQRQEANLDVLTGFHLMDGFRHLIVLEGPHSGAIRALWDALGVEASECPSDRVLYNDALSFSRRLYADLDLDVMKVRLSEPLSEVVRHPLLYVRDMVPRACFEGVKKINDLAQARTLQAAMRNELFPSAEMFRAVSKELGVPLSVADLQRLEVGGAEEESETSPEPVTEKHELHASRIDRRRVPLDNFNAEHLRQLADRRDRPQTHNFLSANREQVSAASHAVGCQRAASCPAVRVTAEVGPVAHNYSTQRLNSSEMAKRKVQESCRPEKLYSYAPQFHTSGALERDSLAEKLQREALAAKQRWRTSKGWVYPGHKVSLETNRHPKRPDNARRDALKEKWEENTNHAASLKPSVPGREAFVWRHRQRDFNIWRRPPPTFGLEPPSIMAPGALQEKELQEFAADEAKRWAAAVVVHDPQFHCHRHLPATEAAEKGPKASNQIDRLAGLLKDRPAKLGLSTGYDDGPALGVIRDARPERGAFEPGGEARSSSLMRSFQPKGRHSAPTMAAAAGEKAPLYKRRIEGLTVAERENNLFAMNGTVLHPMDAVRFAEPAPV